MEMDHTPIVSILTPVYNGEKFLAECIESVLKQTYQRYEYIIVNNCSTDRTLEIALSYAKKDKRIRIHNNETFVDVIANHNIAFNLISFAAKYCKVVSADDFIFPECVAQMVELAEDNPSVGMVGCFQLSGSTIRWQGFRYPERVIPGRELGRRVLLGGDKTFGFGSPSSTMYRADLVRLTKTFYPNSNPHSDTSACLNILRQSDYGFVYQILSYEKQHEDTQTFRSGAINRYSPVILHDLQLYGPYYLDSAELERQLQSTLADYYRFLATNYVFRRRGREFWEYHKTQLSELGYPLNRRVLYKAAAAKIFKEAVNPKQAFDKLKHHVFLAAKVR